MQSVQIISTEQILRLLKVEETREVQWSYQCLKDFDMAILMNAGYDTLDNLFNNYSHPEVFDILAKNSINLEAKDDNNYTFLHYVCYAGNSSTVKYLIEERQVSYDDNSLLAEATRNGNFEESYISSGILIFQYLLDKGLRFVQDDFKDYLENLMYRDDGQFLEFFAIRGCNLNIRINNEKAIYFILRACNLKFLKTYLRYVRIGLKDKKLMFRKLKISESFEIDQIKKFLTELFDNFNKMLY